MKFPREFYIPAGAAAVRSKQADAVVYLSRSAKSGMLRAVGFKGKAQKPTFSYAFRTEEHRANYVADFFAACARSQSYSKERRAARASFKHTLNVGDLLYTCWGYEQTNREFFEVVRVISDKSVEVREICQEREETGFLSGKCVPLPGQYKSDETKRCRVREGNTVRIDDVRDAYYYERQEVAGVKVGRSLDWSAYH